MRIAEQIRNYAHALKVNPKPKNNILLIQRIAELNQAYAHAVRSYKRAQRQAKTNICRYTTQQ